MEDLKNGSPDVVLTPGEILNRAREMQGLTLHDVSERLKLRPSLIRDIECNRYNQPNLAKTFVKGYIKSYASLLKVDEQTVLHAFDVLMKETEISQQEIIRKQENEKRRIIRVNFLWNSGVVLLSVLAVLLVVYIIYKVFFDTAENVSMTGNSQYSSIPVDYGVRVMEDTSIPEEYADVTPESLVADEKNFSADSVVNRAEEIKQKEFEALQAQVRAGKKPSLADVDTGPLASGGDQKKIETPTKAEAEAKARAEADRRSYAESDAAVRTESSEKDLRTAESDAQKMAAAEKERRELAEKQARIRAEELRKKAEAKKELTVESDGTGEIDILDHVQKQQDIHNSQRKSEYEMSLASGSKDDISDGNEIEIMDLSVNSAAQTAPKSQNSEKTASSSGSSTESEEKISGETAVHNENVQTGEVIALTAVKANVGSAVLAGADRYEVVINVGSGESWVGVYADKKTLLNKVCGKDSKTEVTLESLPAKIVVGAPQFAQVYINGVRVDTSGSKSGVPYRIELKK